MDERTITDTSETVRSFMQGLADHLKPTFPQYAAALGGELFGTKLTNDRWNRIAAILASLAALPGRHFKMYEHDARNPALSAIVIAQKMAAATFGGRRDVTSCLEIAQYLIDEISERIGTGSDER